MNQSRRRHDDGRNQHRGGGRQSREGLGQTIRIKTWARVVSGLKRVAAESGRFISHANAGVALNPASV